MFIQFFLVGAVAFCAGGVVGVLAAGTAKVSANADLREEIYYLRDLLSKQEGHD